MTRSISDIEESSDARQLLELLVALVGTAFRQIVWSKTADEIELTYSQSEVLFYVAEHPACALNRVATAFNVSFMSMIRTVDRLEQKRLLKRESSPKGRRVTTTLTLTDEGARVAQQLESGRLEALERVLRYMPHADRTRAIEGLTILVRGSQRGEPGRRGAL